jgi:hypothetical protein
MKSIKHPVAVKLIEDLIERIPMRQNGTYNKQDPTHFERGWITYNGLTLKYYDCTWGVEVRICTYDDKIELAAIYLTSDWGRRNELIPRDTWHNKWFVIIKQLIKKMPSCRKENEDFAEHLAEVRRYE